MTNEVSWSAANVRRLQRHALHPLALAGTDPAEIAAVICGAHAGEVVPFDIIPFFRAQKSVIGSFVYTKDEVETCLELARRGRIVPIVHQSFPLEQAKDAMDLMESRDFFGKIVLTPGVGA